MEGDLNKFAPKADFLKARAISLHRSGYCPAEVSRMLQITKDTAYRWLSRPEYARRNAIHRQVAKAAKEAEIRDAPIYLPTLAYVPQIQLTSKSKYQMQGVKAYAL